MIRLARALEVASIDGVRRDIRDTERRRSGWRSRGLWVVVHAPRLGGADAAQRDAARTDRRARARSARRRCAFCSACRSRSCSCLGLLVATGLEVPPLTARQLGWTAFGAFAQVVATALMLAAMRARSFVVAVAYTKTEAAQVALFGLVFFGDGRPRR